MNPENLPFVSNLSFMARHMAIKFIKYIASHEGGMSVLDATDDGETLSVTLQRNGKPDGTIRMRIGDEYNFEELIDALDNPHITDTSLVALPPIGIRES